MIQFISGQVDVIYQLDPKTFLHMLEFSWCRGNSEPGTSCFLPLRDVKLFPDDTLSYLVTSSLKGEPGWVGGWGGGTGAVVLGLAMCWLHK